MLRDMATQKVGITSCRALLTLSPKQRIIPDCEPGRLAVRGSIKIRPSSPKYFVLTKTSLTAGHKALTLPRGQRETYCVARTANTLLDAGAVAAFLY